MDDNKIYILKSTIDNPLSRYFLSKLGYCETCKQHRIEVALDLYTEKRIDACLRCLLAESMLSVILGIGGQLFGVNKQELKKQFQNPYWKKGLVNVLTGISEFGIQKPFVPGAPFLIVWDITNQCNLNCKHCYADAGDQQKDRLDTTQAKKVIDTLDKASVPILSFSGGEPLVRNDIFELTKYAADKGIYVGLATNGTLITKEKAKQMKKAGIKFVQISLDGATAASHDSLRGMPGMFKKSIEGIKNCVDQDFFVNIASVATKNNISEIPDIISICDDLNVKWFMLYNFVPVGRGESIVTMDLSPDQREQLLSYLYQGLNNDAVDVDLLSTAPQFARVALQHEYNQNKKLVPTHFLNSTYSGKLFQLAEFIGGCGCGRFYCAMRSNGDIEPCVFFPLKLGDILEDDFSDLWTNNEVLLDLRNREKLDEGCGECRFKYFCGGCRARAYGYTGNYLAADPGCVRNKKEHEMITQEIMT